VESHVDSEGRLACKLGAWSRVYSVGLEVRLVYRPLRQRGILGLEILAYKHYIVLNGGKLTGKDLAEYLGGRTARA